MQRVCMVVVVLYKVWWWPAWRVWCTTALGWNRVGHLDDGESAMWKKRQVGRRKQKRKERMVPVPFPACLSLFGWFDSGREDLCLSLSFSSHLFFFLSHNDDCLFSAFRLFILAAGYAQDLFIYVAFEENDDGPLTSAQPVECQVNSNLIHSKVLFVCSTKTHCCIRGSMVDVTSNNKPLLFCTTLTTWWPSGWLGLRTDLTGYIFLFRMTPIWVYTWELYIVSASHYMCSRKDQIPQSVIHFPGRVVYCRACTYTFSL